MTQMYFDSFIQFDPNLVHIHVNCKIEWTEANRIDISMVTEICTHTTTHTHTHSLAILSNFTLDLDENNWTILVKFAVINEQSPVFTIPT